MERKTRILMIDDDEGIRDSCSQILKKSGYEVVSSSDGYEGLEKVSELKPDIVLLDLKMPGLSGMEVLERITQIDPEIIIIVITGFPSIESAVEAIKKGAYDFLPKPFKSEELRVIVKRGLEKRSLIIEATMLREEKKRLEDNFISMVSHQLRAPLSNVQQYFEVILQGLAGELTSKQREIIEKQKKNITDLLKLLEDWLSMARIDAEVVQKRLQPVNLSLVFQNIWEASEPVAVKENIRINMEGLEDLPEITAVPGLIEEAFKNLVHNAIKYNHHGGEVTVRGRVKEEFVEIQVSDTGIGIDEANLPYIFDEFFRVNSGTHREKSGFGLGLSITRKIIVSHRGTIIVTSKLGEGTTFTVQLPIANR